MAVRERADNVPFDAPDPAMSRLTALDADFLDFGVMCAPRGTLSAAATPN